MEEARAEAEAEGRLITENAEKDYKAEAEHNKEALEKLEKKFSENKESWVDSVVERALA
jgi:F0F1-type ATP synthase membrane subunit b/b'